MGHERGEGEVAEEGGRLVMGTNDGVANVEGV